MALKEQRYCPSCRRNRDVYQAGDGGTAPKGSVCCATCQLVIEKPDKREPFTVRVREVVVAEYKIKAANSNEAREWWRRGIVPIDRRELRTESWEVLEVENSIGEEM
jgi:hypothetical protein